MYPIVDGRKALGGFVLGAKVTVTDCLDPFTVAVRLYPFSADTTVASTSAGAGFAFGTITSSEDSSLNGELYGSGFSGSLLESIMVVT